MVSANPIIGVDINKNKIDMAKKYGLNHGSYMNIKNLNQKIQEVLDDNLQIALLKLLALKELLRTHMTLLIKMVELMSVPKDKVSIYTCHFILIRF